MTVHILELPSEVLLMIFSWIPSRQLLSRLSLVCRQFRDVLSSEWFWRSHYVRLAGSQPCLEQEMVRQWQEGCVQSEFAIAAGAGSLDKKTLTGVVGGLDCVHIMHPALHGASAVIAAGSRDSSIYIWRKRSEEEKSGDGGGRSMRSVTGTTLTGHKGWVWSLTSDKEYRPQLLCSGAWDHSIRIWDVSVGKNIETVKNLHKAAVLSLDMTQRDMLVSTCYDKMVREMDLRTPISVVSSHKQHTRPVLCVASSDRYVYSGSEDNSVCVWDRRGQAELQRIKLSGIVPALCLNYGMLNIASGTVVHTYDATEGSLSLIETFTTGHSRNVTSIFHNVGMVVTASKDSSVRVFSGGMGHQCLASLEHHTSDTTDIDFSRNTLASASADRTIALLTTCT